MNNLKRVKINDTFWGRYEKLITDSVIPYQENALLDRIPDAEKSHAVENFRQAAQVLKSGSCNGEFYGMVFQDSDVAKWLEAASYSLLLKPDPALEKRMDELIDLIGQAQREDGYLNTYFTVKEPGREWTNLMEAHELYCAGHMIEAAVAYYECTGKRSLLDIMCKMADHIYNHFIIEKAPGYPGHPEIELALVRLYEVTHDERYFELAKHFIDVRGVDPEYFDKECKTKPFKVWGMDPFDKEYAQNNMPLRDLTQATGHAVRAVYLYSGMADVAAKTRDSALLSACQALWKNITNRQMYITGGIGATNQGEAFTTDYNLPNDTVYAETCASIGLIFFASRMLHLEKKGEYADVMEQALYNTVLAGMQLDGQRFFYVNPLEVIPGISGEIKTHKHDLPERPKWFGCACCPPNVARLLGSLAEYAWEETSDTIYSHLFIGGSYACPDKGISVHTETGYPYSDKVHYTFEAESSRKLTFAIRIPSWSKDSVDSIEVSSATSAKEISYKDGYLYISGYFDSNDSITLTLDMQVSYVYANLQVASDSGLVAVKRGPLVYCVEGVDNDNDVLSLRINTDKAPVIKDYQADDLYGICRIQIPGYRLSFEEDCLYSTSRPTATECTICAIPYYAWGNRGLNQMRVWLPEMH